MNTTARAAAPHPVVGLVRRAAAAATLRALVLALGAAGLGMAAAPVRAEVWGFVDARGVAHFASERLDERYELFFRGGESFDTARGIRTPRAVAVPTVAPRLIAYFEVSPGFRQVKHHLREAAQQHGVDYELLQALIATESGFDADAVSPKGAVGLMQIMPATAERYGVNGDAKTPLHRKLTDPRTNIRTGTRYLRDLMRMFPGQLDLVLAAYNAGEGAVQRAGNRIPNYRETRNYVKTVLQLYDMLKPPATVARAMNARSPQRVRMQMASPSAAGIPVAGGAAGRGNMPAPAPAPASAPGPWLVAQPGDMP